MADCRRNGALDSLRTGLTRQLGKSQLLCPLVGSLAELRCSHAILHLVASLAGGGAAILVGAGIALAKARAAVKALPILNDVEKDGGSELTLSPECRAILEFNIENKLTLGRVGGVDVLAHCVENWHR